MKPEASIIIRTYNEERMIKRCLKSIYNQNYKNFEIIIVDSESTDNTLKIASEFKIRIIKIKKSKFTYGKALNLGCHIAKGKYLVFLSAHAIPYNNQWLRNLIKTFKNTKIAGVYGKQIPFKNCNPLTKRQMMNHWKNQKKIQTKDSTFCNPNSAILKNIWKKIPFNENLIASEDHDWARKVQKQGYLIAYEPKAIVYHSHNETLKQIFNRHYREFYEDLKIKNNYFNFFILTEAPYNIYKDIKYIKKNKQKLYWIPRSIICNSLLFIAIILASLKNLTKIKK